ncbi:MAG: ribonuclease catalytic domain-containing protein [Thermodesulfobacteriota bacterium]
MQGNVIEYMEQGGFLVALVLESGPERRLRIFNQKGRELNLPQSRVVHAGSRRHTALDREERIRLLEEVAGRRQRLAETIPLADIWEITREQAGASFEVGFFAELAFGHTPDDDEMAAFLRAAFSDRLYFKFREGRLLVHSEETVEQLREKAKAEEQRERLLREGTRRLRLLWDGKDPGDDWLDRDHCLALIRSYYLFGNEEGKGEVAHELLKGAGLTRPHDPFQLLVRAGVWDRNENIGLWRQEIPVDFSGEALQEAVATTAEPAERYLAEGFRDFRHLPLLTIDGSQTRDHDDAIHVEVLDDATFRVGVHITCVAASVRPGSALFREAARRITSIYMADEQIPMLPPQLSEGICSLFVGEERPALSYLARLDNGGRVLETEIVPSVVRVKRHLYYSEVDATVDQDKELSLLYGLSLKLQNRRLEQGAMILPFPDVIVNLDEGEPAGVVLAEVDTPGRQLVAEFMVLANTIAAGFLARRAIPGLFRSQGQPGQRLVHGVQKDLFSLYRQRKHLSPGLLSTEPLPHSGVGAGEYTTATSPIRRFLDLIIQHQTLHALMGKGVLFGEEQLKDWLAAILRQGSRVNLVRQQRHRYWLLRYLEKQGNRRYPAIVLGRGPRKVQVVLSQFLLEGELPPNGAVGARPGDTVMVRIGRVEPLDNLLRLDW